MANNLRANRIGEQIKSILAESLVRDIRDPEINMVSITAVKASPDLSVARVYVTSLVQESNREKMLEHLNNASSFLRTKLSKQMKLRRVPSLYFVYDESIEYGLKMERLIDDIISEDEQKH